MLCKAIIEGLSKVDNWLAVLNDFSEAMIS